MPNKPPADPVKAAFRTLLVATGQAEDEGDRRKVVLRVKTERPKRKSQN